MIDAFHVVNRGEIDRRNENTTGIELTDDSFRLEESIQFQNLHDETEARWRLVGTAWELQFPSRMALEFVPATEMLVTPPAYLKRNDATARRDAFYLNRTTGGFRWHRRRSH